MLALVLLSVWIVLVCGQIPQTPGIPQAPTSFPPDIPESTLGILSSHGFQGAASYVVWNTSSQTNGTIAAGVVTTQTKDLSIDELRFVNNADERIGGNAGLLIDPNQRVTAGAVNSNIPSAHFILQQGAALFIRALEVSGGSHSTPHALCIDYDRNHSGWWNHGRWNHGRWNHGRWNHSGRWNQTEVNVSVVILDPNAALNITGEGQIVIGSVWASNNSSSLNFNGSFELSGNISQALVNLFGNLTVLWNSTLFLNVTVSGQNGTLNISGTVVFAQVNISASLFLPNPGHLHVNCGNNTPPHVDIFAQCDGNITFLVPNVSALIYASENASGVILTYNAAPNSASFTCIISLVDSSGDVLPLTITNSHGRRLLADSNTATFTSNSLVYTVGSSSIGGGSSSGSSSGSGSSATTPGVSSTGYSTGDASVAMVAFSPISLVLGFVTLFLQL